MKKRSVVLIRGASGVGKTTVSKILGEKMRGIVLSYDPFVFDTQPEQPQDKKLFEAGNGMFCAAFESALKYDRDVILDGFLGTHDYTVNNFDLVQLLKSVDTSKHNIYHVILECGREEARKRMQERGQVVPDSIVSKIRNVLESPDQIFDLSIDTQNNDPQLSVKQIIDFIERTQ